jgi:predicted PurR-regulated permease PerM
LLKIVQYFQPFVNLFILSILLAFILNYPVRLLRQAGIPRGYAVGLVFAIAITIITTVGFVLVPTLIEDIGEIVEQIPQWLESSRQQLPALQRWVAARHLPINITESIGSIAEDALTKLDDVADRVLTFTLVTLGSFSQIALTLVLTFYFLLDGTRFVEVILQRLPAQSGEKIQRSLQKNFQNYFVSQLTIALLTGGLLTIVLLILRVDFPLLFGISAGVMALIPFGDTLVYATLGGVTALQDVQFGVQVLAIAFTLDFFIDQILSPRLVGEFIGLRPIFVITALLIGAKLGGLLGVVLAVPLTCFFRDAIVGFANYEETAAVNQPSTEMVEAMDVN